MTFDEFKESFSKYQEYHANIGAPGRIEGAAGSLYVEVPVQVYGGLITGEEFNMLGSVQLRRVHDVPASTPEQPQCHIAASNVKTGPQQAELIPCVRVRCRAGMPGDCDTEPPWQSPPPWNKWPATV